MASPAVTYSTVNTVLQISDYGNGKYEIEEVKSGEASFPGLHSANRHKIDFPLPVPGMAAVGYYDTDDKEIGLYFTMLGEQVGTKYAAGIDSGINIELNLLLAKGSVGIFKRGNELKGRYSISIGVGPFSKNQDDEFHILNL